VTPYRSSRRDEEGVLEEQVTFREYYEISLTARKRRDWAGEEGGRLTPVRANVIRL
jgi:hypothetical protein